MLMSIFYYNQQSYELIILQIKSTLKCAANNTTFIFHFPFESIQVGVFLKSQ